MISKDFSTSFDKFNFLHIFQSLDEGKWNPKKKKTLVFTHFKTQRKKIENFAHKFTKILQ